MEKEPSVREKILVEDLADPTREELHTIHSMLSQDASDSPDETGDSSDGTDISETVITTSAGSVDKIRGIFQAGLSHTAEYFSKFRSDLQSHSTDHYETPVKQGHSSDNCFIQGLPASLQMSDHTGQPSKQQHQQLYKHADHVRNDQGVSASDINVETDQKKTDKTPNKKNRNKRKKTASDEKTNTPPECSNNSHLYPVFMKKDKELKEPRDLKELKEPKDQRDSKSIKEAKKLRRQKRQKTEEELKIQANETTTVQSEDITKVATPSLEVLDIRTVVDLVQKFNDNLRVSEESQEKKLQTFKSTLSQQLSDFKKDLKSEIDTDVASAMNQYEETITGFKSAIEEQKMKNYLLTELLSLNQQIVGDINKRLGSVEQNLSRKSAILTGLTFSDKKHERNMQIENFFQDTLSVDADIEDSYYIGGTSKRIKPVVLVFNTMKDKNKVFERKSQLQKYQGQNGQDIYLNNYLPQEINEKRRQEKDLLRGLKQSKVQHEFTENGLKIGADLHKKKITEPNPTELLDMKKEELDEILQVETVKGKPLQIKDNVLLPYSFDARNHQGIRQAYMKIRLMHARARHIICAYMLPGEEFYYNQDALDDGDFGAGRVLLQFMKDNQLFNKAIFIARFCGKKKLQHDRFQAYIEAARQVMVQTPYNCIIKQDQILTREERGTETRKTPSLQQHNKQKNKTPYLVPPCGPKQQKQLQPNKPKHLQEPGSYSAAVKN